MGDIAGEPSAVLEEVAYLGRSENRVAVLESLSSAAYSARALREATGISKATLSRILNEFEDRSWARRTANGEYVSTDRADHIMGQFEPFIKSMRTIRELGDDLGVIPVDELTIGPTFDVTVGLHHFADATVQHQSPVAQGVGRTKLKEAFRDTSAIHVLTDMAPSGDVGTVLQDRADEGDLSGVHVWTTELYDHLVEQSTAPPNWDDLVKTGTSIYHFDGAVPANVCVVDDSAFIWGATDELRHRVLISRNETVRNWGLAVIERYRDEGEKAGRTAFGEG